MVLISIDQRTFLLLLFLVVDTYEDDLWYTVS
jgi:hypothetical protein